MDQSIEKDLNASNDNSWANLNEASEDLSIAIKSRTPQPKKPSNFLESANKRNATKPFQEPTVKVSINRVMPTTKRSNIDGQDSLPPTSGRMKLISNEETGTKGWRATGKLLSQEKPQVFKKDEDRPKVLESGGNIKEREQSRLSRWAEKYEKFNNNIWVAQITGFIIMISIFGDDLRGVFLKKAQDAYVDYFFFLLMLLFSLEILSNILIKRLSYVLSFLFFFDFISTISMILDISMFSEGVLNDLASSGSGGFSQVGARIGKIIRMVRLIRLLRLSKALSKSNAGAEDEDEDFLGKELDIQEKAMQEILKAANEKNRKTTSGTQEIPQNFEFDRLVQGPKVKDKKLKFTGKVAKIPQVELEKYLSRPELVIRAIERAKELRRLTGMMEKTSDHEAIKQDPKSGKGGKPSIPVFKKIKFPKKSYAGKIWNDRSIKKLIFLILVMNIAILFFSSDYYTKTTKVWDYDVNLLGEMYQANFGEALIRTHLENLMSRYQQNDISVLKIKVEDLFTIIPTNVIDKTTLRNSELAKGTFYIPDTDKTIYIEIDISRLKFFENLFQLLSMVFIVSMLLIAYLFSSKDTNNFITVPLNKIADIINNVYYDPLDIIFNPFVLEQAPEYSCLKDLESEYREIGDTLVKICIWLAKSYGRKQLPIIANKLIISNGVSLQRLIGTKYCAYFSIIQLSQLMDQASLHDPDSILFVLKVTNEIMGVADRYGAGTLPLSDDKFFLIWKLADDSPDNNFKRITRESSETASIIITANLKILSKIACLTKGYCSGKFNEQSFAHSTIHCGTLYESIVGSKGTKLDVHYFGIDLNALHCFHSVSELYKTNMLLTEMIYSIIPECMRVKCRKVDIIKFPFYPAPIDIYTIDVRFKDLPSLYVTNDIDLNVMDRRLLHTHMRDYVSDKLIKGAKNSLFLEDSEIQALFAKKYEFRRAFKNGMDFYILGAWDSARQLLEKALESQANDGPSLFLLNYMKTFDFKKPENWRGYRYFGGEF
jgi:hypothetical protein